MELRSDYRLMENNCQHFAKALVRDITGQDFGPKMIAEVLKPYVDFVDNAKSLVRLRTHSMQLSPTPERPFFQIAGTSNIPSFRLLGGIDWEGSLPRSAAVDEEILPLVASVAPSSPTPRSILWQWAGLQGMLHPTEKEYLDGLHLGSPKLVEEFNVVDEGGSGGVSTCVLFPKVLLLFREQHESTHLHFERGGCLHHVDHGVLPKWSCYAVLFPRHISNIAPTPNGKPPQ
jgi:hypothetical protein